MKAKVFVESDNFPSYLNIVAAIFKKHPNIKEIAFVFINKPIDEEFIDRVQVQLSDVSKDDIYRKAARVHFSGEAVLFSDHSHIKKCNIVDVTALSKEKAMSLIAYSIENGGMKICTLQWLDPDISKKGWLLMEDNHKYSNLLSEESTSRLHKNYGRKTIALLMFFVLVTAFVVIFSLSLFVPAFKMPSEVVSALGLIIGLASLFLAWLSMKA